MSEVPDLEMKLTIEGFRFAEPATFEMKSRALAFSALLDQDDPRPADEDGEPWDVFVHTSLHITSRRTLGPHLSERWVWNDRRVIDHYLTLSVRETQTTIGIENGMRTRKAAKLLAALIAAFVIANTGGEVPS